MSKYTTLVKTICEVNAGFDNLSSASNVDECIELARKKIFNFDYPFYDENYRSVFEHKFLKHFYMREIGLETVGLWKLKLNIKLNDIMRYYNRLYESELIEFNPIYTNDIIREHKGKKEDVGKRTGELNNESKTDGTGIGKNKNVSRDLYSDTPQGSLTGVENETYLTNARKIIDDNSSNSETHNNVKGKVVNVEDNTLKTTDDYVETVKGYSGYDPNKMLKNFRENLLNIDLMIFDELEELFMQLW